MKDIHPMTKYDGHINVISGTKISFIDPKPHQITKYDIARGLANNAHFGGHTTRFFSIAEHCLLVINLLPKNASIELQLAALLHDASEAYLGDMVKPLKLLMPDFVKIEMNMMKVIFEKYGLDYDLLKVIKPYDWQAQEIEYERFYKGKNDDRLRFMLPEDAFKAFLNAWALLDNFLTLKTN